jgi:2,3-diaminopropionate biosynthesis protein SbnA
MIKQAALKEILLEKIRVIEHLIGDTKVMPLSGTSKGIYAKLEYTNFSGSIKDRATLNILKNAIEAGKLNDESTIIESTSGNFGISLALFSIALGIKFIPVIDANISSINRKILKLLSTEVVEVTERDESGGFLLNRIKVVEEYKSTHSNAFHPDQYKNEDNYRGYQKMADEILTQFDELHYLIISVSTGGTLTGLSSRIKKYFPDIKVVAVDVEGSLVFSNIPKKRHLSGLGASIKSQFIDKQAEIDEVIILSESEIVQEAQQMVLNDCLFAGASSGAAYCGAKKILQRYPQQDVKILIICPDRGVPYIDNVYNCAWRKKLNNNK